MLVRMWSNRNSHSLLVGMQNGTATSKNNFSVLAKLNILLLYNPAIVNIYPDEFKTYVHIKT